MWWEERIEKAQEQQSVLNRTGEDGQAVPVSGMENNHTKRHTSTQTNQDIAAHEVGIMDKVGEEFYDANRVIMDDGRGDGSGGQNDGGDKMKKKKKIP